MNPSITQRVPQRAAYDVRVQTVNELNDHSHWRERQRRAANQHLAVRAVLGTTPVVPLPVRVTFTRYSPGKLDSDGACAAMKFIRDAVAKHYGVDDGGDQIEWVWPVQQQRSKGYAVSIAIEPLPAAPAEQEQA